MGLIAVKNVFLMRGQGSLMVGDIVTFTTIDGQSTIGGEEGTIYSTTIIVSDSLSNMTTAPVSATARRTCHSLCQSHTGEGRRRQR